MFWIMLLMFRVSQSDACCQFYSLMERHRGQGSQITNNHDYLNFIKKNHRMIDLQKSKLLLPAPLEVNRNGSVFALKDTRRDYRLQKLAQSTNSPAYHLQLNHPKQDTDRISAQIIGEILERKNREIQQAMSRERQSVSEIIYNYSKFRSMETNYYRNEKAKRKSEKLPRPEEQRKEDLLRLPHVSRNNQEVLTIEQEPESKRRIGSNDVALKSQSLMNEARDQKDRSRERQLMRKKELAQLKRKRLESQFGIEIKSINSNKLTDIQLRKEMFQFNPDSVKKIDRIDNDLYFNRDRQEVLQKIQSLHSLPNNDYKIISSKQINGSGFFLKSKPKCSSSSLSNNKYEENEIESPIKQEEKEKQFDSVTKRDNLRKNIIIPYQKQLTIYDQKINYFRQFLFMMNFVHKKYDMITLRDNGSFKNEEKYKIYIGMGNNSLLVKSLIKRRFWWTIEDDYKKANFVWTQLKINNFYQFQIKSETYNIDSKIETNSDGIKPKKTKNKQIETKAILKNIFKPPLPNDKQKIMTSSDKKIYDYIEQTVNNGDINEKLIKYSNRLRCLQISTFTSLREDKNEEKMHNHLQFNHFIGNKKALFYNLKRYYDLMKKNVFQVIPLTFHIKQGSKDPQLLNFMKQFKRLDTLRHQQRKKKERDTQNKKIKNIWIIKPGELSNRGNGIVVIKQVFQLMNIIKKKEKHADGNEKTYIVQKYIENPLLYKGRKFDIRHYMIITRLHGIMRAYWYGQGYIRTSSSQFDLDDVGDEMIHLTNDAIQKNSTFYGKHEEGNKLSYHDFQKYLDLKYGEEKISFADHIYPKMKSIATDSIRSTYLQLDTNNLEHNFQIFGLDFMIDDKFDVWLIQVNTNPCLQLSSKLLGRIIPNMLQHAFRLSIDVIFPPPTHYPNSQKYLAPDNPLGRLMYELIFDEARDGRDLVQLYRNTAKIDYGEVMEDEQTYENQGKQIELVVDIS